MIVVRKFQSGYAGEGRGEEVGKGGRQWRFRV